MTDPRIRESIDKLRNRFLESEDPGRLCSSIPDGLWKMTELAYRRWREFCDRTGQPFLLSEIDDE